MLSKTIAGHIAAMMIVASAMPAAHAEHGHTDASSVSLNAMALLVRYANATNASAAAQGSLLRALPRLANRRDVSVETLADVGNKAGLDVAVRHLSLRRFAALRNIGIVALRGSDRFAVVLAVGRQYSIIWNNSGTDDYISTRDLERHYAGLVMLPRAARSPVVAMRDPIVTAITGGPMSYVTERIAYRNVSGAQIHVVPQPCGCSGAPRGKVDIEVLKPGQQAILTVTSMMPQFDPFCLPIPIQTNDRRCPVVYVGLMCLPPPRATAYPRSVQISAPQFVNASSTVSVYLPAPGRLTEVRLEHSDEAISISHEETKTEGPPSLPHGKVLKIDVSVRGSKTRDPARNDVLISYAAEGAVHTLRLPCTVCVRPDVWTSPGELFLGATRPGTYVKAEFAVKSHSSRPVSVKRVGSSDHGDQFSCDDGKMVKALIRVPSTSSGYFRGSITVTLGDGASIAVPYSGMASQL